MTNKVQCKCGELSATATVTIKSSLRRPDVIMTSLVYSDVRGKFYVENRSENVISCASCGQVAVTTEGWK